MLRARAPFHAAAIALALVACAGIREACAAPVDWSTALAAETDTVAFARFDGSLVKAPFHLAGAVPLWTAQERASLIRFRVSPDGRSVAWLTRTGDEDSTWLWIGASAPARPRVRYRSLVARNLSRMHFEPELPTTRDPGIRGGRLLGPSPQNLRHSSNSLVWMPDASGVAFGYDDGLAFLPADSGSAREVSKAWIVELRGLDPAAVLLADLIAVVDDRRTEGWHLVYLAGERWRVFASAGLDPGATWTASSTTVWWVEGGNVRAIQVHDPTPSTVASGSGAIPWIHHDPATRTLYWTQGEALFARSDGDSQPREVRRFGAPVVRGLAAAGGATFGFHAGDRLHLWSPAGGVSDEIALEGFVPERLFVHGGTLVLAGAARGKKLELARWRAGGRLEREGSGGGSVDVVWAAPSGSRLVLANAGRKAPETMFVYDISSRTWVEARNPGIIAWEPMQPW